jgi:Ca2+/Na+ antiporter
MLKILEVVCWPTLTILELVLPTRLFPEITFLAIVCLFFAAMDFILTVVSVLSVYTHMSHMLIGLTIISWGSSPIELINLIIANKKNELQMGLTSILSGIVLAFFVLIPLAMIFKMMRRNTHQIQILQPIHSSHLLMMPALVATACTLLIYWKSNMNIGKGAATMLILIYVVYITFMTVMLYFDTQ